MSYITGLALRRRPVTILAIILILGAGVFAYNNLQRELFPEIEFPNITVVTIFPDANPRAVERDVSEEIEDAIDGLDGVKEIQSTSSESVSLVLVTYEFGEDMEEAERDIESAINNINFPDGVNDPIVSRISNDTFPVIQLTVIGDRDVPSLQRLMDDLILPPLERIEGVFRVDVAGKVDEKVFVTVDTNKLEDLGISMQRVTSAVRENNSSFPAGDIDSNGTSFTVRTANEFRSLDEIRDLAIGFERPIPGGVSPAVTLAGRAGARELRISDVASVELSTADATSISRSNGKPSLTMFVLKDPEANTVEVTEDVLATLDELKDGLPPDIEVLTLSNDGPETQELLDSLLQEGLIGFLFAVTVVFLFLMNIRPTLLKGAGLAIRPTIVIALSIPLSLLTGVLLMATITDLTLNFMTLAGLAIAVGRVVDDSIVVLENTYRHIQRGEDRFEAAFLATREVSAAIISSTLTTIAVFLPLGFIQGLVGSFFSPFAFSVSFALAASTIVAMTAVPVLSALLLRRNEDPGELIRSGSIEGDAETNWQRAYTPALLWALRHKAITLIVAVAVTVGSMGLTLFIPVTLFPAGSPQFLTMDIELPTGTGVRGTFPEVLKVEEILEDFRNEGIVELYQVTIGGSSDQFGPGGASGGFNKAGFFIRLNTDLSEGFAEKLRERLPGDDVVTITIAELSNGPPAGDLEITITGNNFTAITEIAGELEADLATIDGVINLKSDVSEAKDEVVINVDPQKAAEFDLTTTLVGLQVNRFIVGQTVGEMDLEGTTLDIAVRGEQDDVNDIEKLKNLTVEGRLGQVKLGTIADISVKKGPVSISRFDNERSASITGVITSEDTQAIGRLVEEKIAALDLPPGVDVKTGGIFQQIAEGFEDIFQAMAIGVILVYLVMVASLGSLRNPFIIVLSLPLAVVGAMVALLITGRTLSLSALMGFLLLIGVVVTNAIVMLTFVEQLRERGVETYEALIEGARVRLRPILMTAFTTTFALVPLAVSGGTDGGIIGAELATVVIGGLVSSTFLTLIVVPVIYMIFHQSIPSLLSRIGSVARRIPGLEPPPISGRQPTPGDD